MVGQICHLAAGAMGIAIADSIAIPTAEAAIVYARLGKPCKALRLQGPWLTPDVQLGGCLRAGELDAVASVCTRVAHSISGRKRQAQRDKTVCSGFKLP